MYGDVHITSRTALGFIPYRHFGVEMPGGGICENSLPGVRVVPFPAFARDRPTCVRNPGATPAERDLAVQRAASRIGERRYSLTLNNCEHFANWCATGVAISHQVIAFFQMLLRAAIALVAGFAVRAAFAG
jgi:hypothetical protein